LLVPFHAHPPPRIIKEASDIIPCIYIFSQPQQIKTRDDRKE
jgi:hypothetical protein